MILFFHRSGEDFIKRLIEGEDRSQRALFLERLDDSICEDNPVRVVNIFVNEHDLSDRGFQRVASKLTDRPTKAV